MGRIQCAPIFHGSSIRLKMEGNFLHRWGWTWGAGQSTTCWIHHTGAKIRNLYKNSHFENLSFDKIHIFKISILTTFTFWKSQFWQNSHFENLIFDKIHISKISFMTKFTFWKYIFDKIHIFQASNSREFLVGFCSSMIQWSYFLTNIPNKMCLKKCLTKFQSVQKLKLINW